jgi:hypothetical protein
MWKEMFISEFKSSSFVTRQRFKIVVFSDVAAFSLVNGLIHQYSVLSEANISYCDVVLYKILMKLFEMANCPI